MTSTFPGRELDVPRPQDLALADVDSFDVDYVTTSGVQLCGVLTGEGIEANHAEPLLET